MKKLDGEAYRSQLDHLLFARYKDIFSYCVSRDPARRIVLLPGLGSQRLHAALGRLAGEMDLDTSTSHVQTLLWQRRFLSRPDQLAGQAACAYMAWSHLLETVLGWSHAAGAAREERGAIAPGALAEDALRGTMGALDDLSAIFHGFLEKLPRRVRDCVMEAVSRAMRSQEFCAQCRLPHRGYVDIPEAELLVDRVVQFQKGGCLLAACGSGDPRMAEAAEAMGRVLWLARDLCLFMEDWEKHRPNGLLVSCGHLAGPILMEERAQEVVSSLEAPVRLLMRSLREVRGMAGEPLFAFLGARIWRLGVRVREHG